MSIDKIRNRISSYKGQTINFRFNGSRNQIEEFSAVVVDVYPSVFTVKVVDSNYVKSFSYSDILIKKLVLTSVL